MSDILEEIQELSNKFSNLFEVEGLGNPAVDVPPSQNKIKKDRKTKDGKVEVVSVEDELFPYEGNKREQYRQKILDTINNMIQGTATLEDLLQIVRQKKAPLKEAMEVLESIISEYTEEDKKEAAKKVLPQRKAEFDKAFNDYEKVHSKIDPKRILNYKLTPVEQYRANKTATKLERAQDRLNHAQEVAGNVEKTPHGLKIKEAMELMEELLLERNKENKIKKNKAIEDIGQEYINGREEEGEDLEPYGDDPKQWGRDITSTVGDTLGVKRVIPKLADKLEHSGISELSRKLRKKPFYDKEGRNKIIDGLYLQALNKAKKENSKEALKEALSLMEEIINEVSVKKWKEAAKNSIEGKHKLKEQGFIDRSNEA